MSVDTVNEALTEYRLWVQNHRDWFFDSDETLAIMNRMRDHLMDDNIDAFVTYVQFKLAGAGGDTVCSILTELFAKLNVYVWEEFEAILRS